MQSFQDSIEKMLWPERRDHDSLLGNQVPGLIDRTTEKSFIVIPAGFLPDTFRPLLSPAHRFLPALFGEQDIVLGPIPKGTPVGLLSNLDLLGEGLSPEEKVRHQANVLSLLLKMKHDLAKLPADASDQDAERIFANLVPDLLALSKCRDYVVNRGHYFGTSFFNEEPGLSESDKKALIEFVKTF
jgi:hypothetical protein